MMCTRKRFVKNTVTRTAAFCAPLSGSTLLLKSACRSTCALSSVWRGHFVQRRGVTLAARALSPPQAAKSARATPSASLVAPSITAIASTGAGVLVLGFIVFVHECGHYLAARWQNIRVKNFSIGFGPKLFSFTPKHSETEFSIRLLPLGGYVAFPEHVVEDEESGEQKVLDDENMLQNRPILDRAVVISAGVIANLILAWSAVFTSTAVIGVPTYMYAAGVRVENVVDAGGAAARAGIRAGDVIVAVNGKAVGASLESASHVAAQIRNSKGQALHLGVLREQQSVQIRVEPKCCLPDGSSVMGVQLNALAAVKRERPANVVQTVRSSNREFWRLCRQTWQGLVSTVGNFEESSKNLSGPIGVVSMGAQLARNDSWALLTFCAVISINLAVINALPLPALDGGQMVLLVVEGLKGSPVSLRVQEAINRSALLLLLAFSGALFVGDLERLHVLGAIQQLFG
ncbi:hypothetical protein BWQ96_07155 [Gracilariopsis chorda]|uniref:PDZ domain-containing protein n=1 Tax=Gracilariopsis chorda TaxID=448386 RepID=A0A2V3IM05_9FLOR|nr:hypothetical protein BWQ96_07155 [Gracilariopsis chorda]|eukprot:PXF43121.1 hypothetical protein BWQ96_07155 [Gracilariopsis chorda]